MSNIMPYVSPLLKVLWRRGICCCKRKNYKPNTYMNEEFPIERKYASNLTTVFVCCTFGSAIPSLFLLAFILLLLQNIFDKLLITYYYKTKQIHNDFLNRSSLKVMKYAFFLFPLFAALALASNWCTISNEPVPIKFSN